MTAERVAVLGTGIMGAPMARNLLRAGFPVRVWNRTPAKAAPLGAAGAEVAATPAQAVEGARFVLTMLADGAAVEATMAGAEGALAAMAPDAVWVQCSTVGLAATQRLAALAAQRGVPFVDAPVLGTRGPAEEGTLTVLASGPDDALGACAGVFAAVGARVCQLGAAGGGSRLKLVMNSWVLALVAATAEAVALAEALGLDPRLFLSTLEGGALDVPYAHLKGEAMIARRFPAAFPSAGALKDAGLILEAATAAGVRADVVEAVRAKFERTVAAGHGEQDMASAYLASAAGSPPAGDPR